MVKTQLKTNMKMNTRARIIQITDMKRIASNLTGKAMVLSLILMMTGAFALQAQQTLQHAKRIYRSDDNKLFVNKDLPLYIRVATSPDEDADSWLLESSETGQYANPMYLDTEGWNSFRSPSAVDTASKEVVYPLQDVVFDMYADGEPPQSSLIYGDSKVFRTDNLLFLGDDVDLKFETSDEMSGVEDVYYSVDGDDYKALKEYPLDITEEGTYQLMFYAVDNVGNMEDVETLRFAIDKTPPVTKHSIEGINKNKVLSPDATISLSASDSISGVSEIYYSIDDEAYKPYTEPIPVSLLNDGESKVAYYARDKVGNIEEAGLIGTIASANKRDQEDGETFDYYIDREPPQVQLSFEGDYHEGDQEYISERTRVVLDATDDKSGVQKILYSYNSFLTEEEYEAPFNPEGNSPVKITYTAIDMVENAANEKSQNFYIDRVPPGSEISFDGPVFSNRDTTFIAAQTLIELAASDKESGVNFISYTLNKAEKRYEDPFVAGKAGHNSIEWMATDNVNNEEEKQSLVFIVDDEAPVIHHHFSVDPIGEKVVRDEKYIIYPSNTKVYIGATDNLAGEESLEYSVNGGKIAKTIPVTGLEPGNYEIDIEAADALENTSAKTIRFAIEK